MWCNLKFYITAETLCANTKSLIDIRFNELNSMSCTAHWCVYKLITPVTNYKGSWSIVDMHELSLAEENYGQYPCFQSDGYSSGLQCDHHPECLCVVHHFSCESVHKCNYVFLFIIKLNGFGMQWAQCPVLLDFFTECTIRILFILLINVMFS